MGKIVDGKVEMNGNVVTSGQFDFVVTIEGNIMLGRKHTYMSKGADVQAAGTLKLRNGKVVNIDNNSGHYVPNLEQTLKFKQIFQENGVDVSKAHLKVYNEKGQVIHHEKPNPSKD